MDRLAQMLDMQRELQRAAYRIDPASLPPTEKIQFIKDMTLALTDELHEVLAEVDWKPWTHGERQINVENYKKELVDCWHFFQNLMLAVDMTSDELYEMYVKKRQVNANRQLQEYDGRSTKCPACKRALEDVSLTEIKISGTNITDVVLCACGATLDRDVALQFITD